MYCCEVDDALYYMRGCGDGGRTTKEAHQEDARFPFCVSHPANKTRKTKGRGCGKTHTPNNKITILARALKFNNAKRQKEEICKMVISLTVLRSPIIKHNQTIEKHGATHDHR